MSKKGGQAFSQIGSEGLYKNNQGLGFGALAPLCRGLRDQIIARAQGKLFI